ncbi:MAG: SWIM zinc finger family protein [Thermoanaerobaculia bacterium]
MSRDGWWRNFYPKSTPIAAKGGIKSRSKRGAFATQWWARRWIEVLESLNLGGRLQRGRSYARKGQVLSIEIEPGNVRASVQGSRPRPYLVSIHVPVAETKEIGRLQRAVAGQPYIPATLLAGKMPEEIEEVFRTANVSLFPSRASELRTDCSCPDWSNPCKHIAAVYYLLGEEFDRDPFLIFRMRGIDPAELVGSAGAMEMEIEEDAGDGVSEILQRGSPPPGTFWEGRRPDVSFAVEPGAEARPAALLQRLGGVPFWRGEEPIVEMLRPAYESGAKRGRELIAGEGDVPGE